MILPLPHFLFFLTKPLPYYKYPFMLCMVCKGSLPYHIIVPLCYAWYYNCPFKPLPYLTIPPCRGM